MSFMFFRSPLLLVLVPALLPILGLYYFKRHESAATFSSVALFGLTRITWRVRLRHVPFYLRLVAITLFIVALAGPQTVLEESKLTTEGISIVLALDSSTSMAAEDFTLNGERLNRLAVIKKVVSEFIAKRRNDRIGLIAFAQRPYTVSPLTTDHSWLQANLDRIQFGIMEDGTAIGSAILAGVNRLRGAPGKSKVMILLTDGINNAGKIPPLTAAQAAQTYGIKIYAIGAGTRGLAPYPVTDLFGRTAYQNVKIDIDEDTLTRIAQMTGGKYFRATDTETLSNIYAQIDALEKVKFEESGYRLYNELFYVFLLAGLAALVLELFLGRTVFLKVP
jgi:Ca-activated chloride channel family protein